LLITAFVHLAIASIRGGCATNSTRGISCKSYLKPICRGGGPPLPWGSLNEVAP